jgi:hypothetical protein
MAGDFAINILLAGDIAIQNIGGGRYCNKYIYGLFSNTPLKLSKMFRYPPQTLHNVLIPPTNFA